MHQSADRTVSPVFAIDIEYMRLVPKGLHGVQDHPLNRIGRLTPAHHIVLRDENRIRLRQRFKILSGVEVFDVYRR